MVEVAEGVTKKGGDGIAVDFGDGKKLELQGDVSSLKVELDLGSV